MNDTQRIITWFETYAQVMRAHLNGVCIQYFDEYDESWHNCAANEPAWDNETRYRVKPEPVAKWHPLDKDELNNLVGHVIIKKKDGRRSVVVGTCVNLANNETCCISCGFGCLVYPHILLIDYTDVKGLPLGRLELT